MIQHPAFSARLREMIAQRPLVRIRQQVERLCSSVSHADREAVIGFCRGHRALLGNRDILSREGRKVFSEASALVRSNSLTGITSLLQQLPTVRDPKLGLFIDPFDEDVMKDPHFAAFRAFFNSAEDGMRVIQISSGCQNRCLMCAFDPSETESRMRFPVLLKIAERLIERRNADGFANYEGNDIFQWRDLDFDADYGDAAFHLKRMGYLLDDQMTNGIWPLDPYGSSAAVKCGLLHIDIGLTAHIFYKRIFPFPGSQPDLLWLERYAAVFAHSIDILTPVTVVVRAVKESPHPCFNPEFLERFYEEMVLPRVQNRHLAELYSLRNKSHQYHHRSRGRSRVMMDDEIHAEGRAFNNPYFPGLRQKGTAEEGIVAKVDALGGISVMVNEAYGKSLVLMPSPHAEKAKTVEEYFPSPDQVEFAHFLLKLRFIIQNPGGSFIKRAFPGLFRANNLTLNIWETFFPFLFKRKEIGFLLSGLSSIRNMKENAAALHEAIKDLPIVERFTVMTGTVDGMGDEDLKQFLILLLLGKGLDFHFLKSFEEGSSAVELLKKSGFYLDKDLGLHGDMAEARRILEGIPRMAVYGHEAEGIKTLKVRFYLPVRAKTGGSKKFETCFPSVIYFQEK